MDKELSTDALLQGEMRAALAALKMAKKWETDLGNLYRYAVADREVKEEVVKDMKGRASL